MSASESVITAITTITISDDSTSTSASESSLKEPEAAAEKGILSMYDETGKIRSTQEDVCDCFESDCPGCYFPCESCKSQKCGQHCRQNRNFAYELVKYDGKNFTKANPLI